MSSSLGELKTVITIGELLRILMERAGMNQKQYAAVLQIEREHLNGVMNGRPGYKGSPELIDKALKHAGLEWKDVLHPPVEEDTLDENTRIIEYVKLAISRGGTIRDDLKDQIELLQKQEERRKKKGKRFAAAPSSPLVPRERIVAA